MPEFLEKKLKAEYGSNSKITYKIMNKIGAMSGSNETKKGAEMEAKHIAKTHGHPGTPERVNHVHQHLQTPHVEPHKGVTVDGEPHAGPVAGSLPKHHNKSIHPIVHHYADGRSKH